MRQFDPAKVDGRQYYALYNLYWQDKPGEDWELTHQKIREALASVGVDCKLGTIERCPMIGGEEWGSSDGEGSGDLMERVW